MKTDEPYIWTCQAGQVFYVKDSRHHTHGDWHVSVNYTPRDHFNISAEKDDKYDDEEPYQADVLFPLSTNERDTLDLSLNRVDIPYQQIDVVKVNACNTLATDSGPSDNEVEFALSENEYDDEVEVEYVIW